MPHFLSRPRVVHDTSLAHVSYLYMVQLFCAHDRPRGLPARGPRHERLRAVPELRGGHRAAGLGRRARGLCAEALQPRPYEDRHLPPFGRERLALNVH